MYHRQIKSYHTAEVRRLINESFHGPHATVDDFVDFPTKLQINRAESNSLPEGNQAGHEVLIRNPLQQQPSRERWGGFHDWDKRIGAEIPINAVHSKVLQAREQADEAEKFLDAAPGVSQCEGPNGGLEDVAMLVQPEERLPYIEIPDVQLLKMRKRVQADHRLG